MMNERTRSGIPDARPTQSPEQTGPKPLEAIPPAASGTTNPQVRQKGFLPWWVRLVVWPVGVLAVGLLLVVAVGVVQKLGGLRTEGGKASQQSQPSSAGEEGEGKTMYICPMMHIPPQPKPGRCPICGMELVPMKSEAAQPDARGIMIEPVARRLAGIRTVRVQAKPLVRKIRAIGLLSYNEEMVKTIAAYVDGRLERMYANYTGMVVAKGEPLVRLYSPQLYAAQVELLLARQRKGTPLSGSGGEMGGDLYSAAKVRLTEWGMTPAQIEQIEQAGVATARMDIVAPMSGTIIEKLAVEGQYVKTGEPIYRLADLSTVWLILQLFPEEASLIRYGHQVEAQVQSLPGQQWKGRVAFVQPTVDPQTRTVAVRVVIDNSQGRLRVGDYATATITVELDASGQPLAEVYDPELAGKWISPRHPQVIQSSPGQCSVCGVDLVPAHQFGFSSQPVPRQPGLVVPRDAVLMAGPDSVVYVETQPGRFEMRRVVLGPSMGEEIAILQGLQEGELVAASGNFLIDSQTQLAGRPSLLDPRKAQQTAPPPSPSHPLDEALRELSPEDRLLAEQQKICPVSGQPLGSMGKPIQLMVNNSSIFLCCEGCRDSFLADPDKYLSRLSKEHRHDR